MTENQKLRDAIKRLLKAHRITVQAPPKTVMDAESQLDEIRNAVKFAEEALALPTAAQVSDINVVESFTSVAKTAAPVGERESFEQFAQNCPMGKYSVTRRGEGYDSSHTQIMWDTWQARATLAGDADGKRWRYAMDWGQKDFAVCMRVGKTGVCWEPIKTDGPIDQAMARGGE